MRALKVENLSKNFGGIQALLNINLNLNIGERRGIIGPNGAGKTTIFHLISGLMQPSQGSIYLFGTHVTRSPAHKRVGLGLGRTFQITELFPDLTVLDNVLLGLLGPDSSKFSLLRSISSCKHLMARGHELLDTLGLLEKRDMPLTSLSHGEQRQTELILAIASKPRLLLLDEPSAGLGPAETEVMCSIIKELPKDMTMLIIEHDIDTASKLVDNVTVLHAGQVLTEGSWDQIRMDSRVQEIYRGMA